MTANSEQAKTLGAVFGLTEEEQKWLKVVPYEGALPTAVPTDPLIYRWYEIVNVYGSTIKELIHEEFGDGIMGAIGQVPAIQGVLKKTRPLARS